MTLCTTSFWWLFIILTTFLLVHLTCKRKQNGKQRYVLPPGPNKLPIFGNLHQLGSIPHRSLWQLSQKYGALMHLNLGLRPTLVVSSAEMAEEVLKVHDLSFCTRPRLISTDKYTYNRSDLNMAPYGEHWREMRKMCMQELFSARRVESFQAIREEEASLMIQTISNSSSKAVNLKILMVSFTNSIICRVALGKKYRGELHKIFDEVEALLGGFFLADYFPTLGWVDKLTGQHSRLEKNASELDAFYEDVIENHLDKQSTRPEHEDIVDVLLRLQNDEGRLTKENIKGVLTDIFIAGTATASAALVWAMAELTRNPTAMQKTQEEIRASLGSIQKVKEKDLHQLPYLKSVVKETLRLHPPVPLLLPREAMQLTKVGGYDVLPRTLVYVNAWGIGRDPKTWDKAEEFIPERFMNSTLDFKGRDFQFIPFGSGRRICPAITMGILAIELALANMLYFFDWKLPCGMRREDIDMDEAPGLNMHKKTPLQLIAVKYTIK